MYEHGEINEFGYNNVYAEYTKASSKIIIVFNRIVLEQLNTSDQNNLL